MSFSAVFSFFPSSFYRAIEAKNMMCIKMLCLSDGVHFYSGTILLTDRYAFGAEIGPAQELCISFAPLHQWMNYWASMLASFHYFQISDMSKMTHLTFHVTNLFPPQNRTLLYYFIYMGTTTFHPNLTINCKCISSSWYQSKKTHCQWQL